MQCQRRSCGGPTANDSRSSKVRNSWSSRSLLEPSGVLIWVFFLSGITIVGNSAVSAAFSDFAPIGASVYSGQAMSAQREAFVQEPPFPEEPSLMENETFTMNLSSFGADHDVSPSGAPVAAPPRRQRLSLSPRRSTAVGRSAARRSPGAKPEQRTPKHRMALMVLLGVAAAALALQYQRTKLLGRGLPRREWVRSPHEKPDSPEDAWVVVPRVAVVPSVGRRQALFVATIVAGAVLRSVMNAMLDYHDVGMFEFIVAQFVYVVLIREIRRLISRWDPEDAEDMRRRNVIRMELLPGGNSAEHQRRTGGRAAGEQ